MEKENKAIYWTSTGLLSALMTFSAVMYFVQHEMVSKIFVNLGYPTYNIMYPLAIAKILGVIAIITKKSSTLKEWAYAGFFFDFVLAFFAHVAIKDGEFMGALLGFIFLSVSYIYDQKLFSVSTN
ncbi:MAG: hypothetical protein ACI86H_002877 [bacterium]|jgi:hypothetical protein